MQLPDGVSRQGPLIADVAVHQPHRGVMVVQDQQQAFRLDVGVLRPDHIRHKAVFQQGRGGALIQGVQAFNNTGFNGP